MNISLSNLVRLCNPKVFVFYWKQYWLVKRHAGRLSLEAWRLSFDRTARIYADARSRIRFGIGICLRAGTEIEALSGAVVAIGDNFFANKNCAIVSRYGVSIGNNCMLAGNVAIYDHDHLFQDYCKNFGEQGYTGAPVVIGNNVWLGTNVFVGKGVIIGDNVVIGAGTVVTRSIPADSVVYASPELVVKPRSSHRDA